MQLVEVRLGGDLAGYLAKARQGDRPKSWRAIAADVSVQTRLTISHEAVRTWHAALTQSSAA